MRLSPSKKKHDVRFTTFGILLMHLSDIQVTIGERCFISEAEMPYMILDDHTQENIKEFFKQKGSLDFHSFIQCFMAQVNADTVRRINKHIYDKFLYSLYDVLPKDEFLQMFYEGSDSFRGHLSIISDIVLNSIHDALTVEMAGLNYLPAKEERMIAEKIRGGQKILEQIGHDEVSKRLGNFKVEILMPEVSVRKNLMADLKAVFTQGQAFSCEPNKVLRKIDAGAREAFNSQLPKDQFTALSYSYNENTNEAVSIQYYDRTISFKHIVYDGQVPTFA